MCRCIVKYCVISIADFTVQKSYEIPIEANFTAEPILYL